jgi:serine/threonine protein kinase/Tfp pilus assembly protein PilF
MIGKTISHYKILEELGRGGMGVVYKAEDLKLKRTVALKFLGPFASGNDKEESRFVREAQAAAALDHPNICTVHEIDEVEGQTFIAMAYIKGKSVKEKIESGPLSLSEVLDIAIQLTEGLHAAHEKGIVHRDIKSANIMVAENGQVKITDFGLAMLAGRTKITKTGTTMGTAAYMSPEQVGGEKIDHRTDIWSLAVVLYEMITGQQPFKGEYEPSVAYSIINEEPEDMAKLRKGVPIELKTIVSKAMTKNAEERYQNAGELLLDLRSLAKKYESTCLTDQISQAESVPSIAVLPLLDMSPQKDQEYFCDGIAEELINALAHVENLRVVARTSAFSFKNKNLDVREIGRKLNVEHVLEGSVRKAGNRVRITAQLVNVKDGYHVWSEKYERDMEDIFAIQDDISLAIADNLKIRLLRKEKEAILKRHTDDLAAYNLYLKGIYFSRMYSAEGFDNAIDYFERSLQQDPKYALAYYGLAEVYYTISYWSNVPPKEAYPKAKTYARKALDIDKTLAEAHAALGLVFAFYEWNWGPAEQELKHALRLSPNSAIIHMSYSWCLSLAERSEEAINEAKRAQELDPLSGLINSHVGHACIWGSQYDRAIEELQMTLKIIPDYYLAHYYLGLAYRAKSMINEAIAEFEKAVDLNAKATFPAMILTATYYESGKKAEGEKLLEILEQRSKAEYLPAMGYFYIHLARGDPDKALEWLKQACEERDSFLPWCKVIPIDSYRIPDEPRFQALLKGFGL